MTNFLVAIGAFLIGVIAVAIGVVIYWYLRGVV